MCTAGGQGLGSVAEVSWLGAAVVGLGLFGYSLTQQTNIQLQMEHTMTAVNQSVVQTSTVVGRTTGALKPLLGTTSALASTEVKEQSTVSALQSMNAKLQATANVESSILLHLGQLNQTTRTVSHSLSTLNAVNSQVLQASRASSGQGQTEASQVGQLNSMTNTSIFQLQQINHRLSALSLLP